MSPKKIPKLFTVTIVLNVCARAKSNGRKNQPKKEERPIRATRILEANKACRLFCKNPSSFAKLRIRKKNIHPKKSVRTLVYSCEAWPTKERKPVLLKKVEMSALKKRRGRKIILMWK